MGDGYTEAFDEATVIKRDVLVHVLVGHSKGLGVMVALRATAATPGCRKPRGNREGASVLRGVHRKSL